MEIAVGYARECADLEVALSGHFILCRPDKAPARPWKGVYPTAGEVFQWAGNGGLIGVVPATLGQGFTVLDCDEGQPYAVAMAAPPALLTPSKTEGRGHLWYPDTESRPNSKWRWRQCAGEIRSGAGYVVLWPGAANQLAMCDALDCFEIGVAYSYAEAASVLWPDGISVDFSPKGLPLVPPSPAQRVADRAIHRNNERYFTEVLGRISSEDYDTWIRVGLALEGSSRKFDIEPETARAIWRNWSMLSSKYTAGEIDAKWITFTGAGNNPLTMASVIQGRML